MRGSTETLIYACAKTICSGAVGTRPAALTFGGLIPVTNSLPPLFSPLFPSLSLLSLLFLFFPFHAPAAATCLSKIWPWMSEIEAYLACMHAQRGFLACFGPPGPRNLPFFSPPPSPFPYAGVRKFWRSPTGVKLPTRPWFRRSDACCRVGGGKGNDLADTGYPTEPINETKHASVTTM